MKKFAIVVCMISVVVLAGCGSSGSGSSTDCTAGESAAEAAFADFATILENDDMQDCLEFSVARCDCPNGGSVTADAATTTLTFVDCTSATNEVYSGTMTSSADFSTLVSANMTEFDGCTNVTATNVVLTPGSCSGTITGTCASQSLNCSIIESGDDCVPGNCSC